MACFGVVVAPGLSWSCAHWESASPTPLQNSAAKGPIHGPEKLQTLSSAVVTVHSE